MFPLPEIHSLAVFIISTNGNCDAKYVDRGKVGTDAERSFSGSTGSDGTAGEVAEFVEFPDGAGVVGDGIAGVVLPNGAGVVGDGFAGVVLPDGAGVVGDGVRFPSEPYFAQEVPFPRGSYFPPELQ